MRPLTTDLSRRVIRDPDALQGAAPVSSEPRPQVLLDHLGEHGTAHARDAV
ncbi:MAG: hypothetical protein IH936_13390 [Acidobacteria bacterium]|nr:hypothetical protein [Acidobacteriota bacterium]